MPYNKPSVVTSNIKTLNTCKDMNMRVDNDHELTQLIR